MPDWELRASAYLGVRTEPIGRKGVRRLRQVLDMLPSGNSTVPRRLVGEPTRVVLYREPLGPTVLEFKYGADEAEACARHLASLQSRLCTMTLADFCEDLGIPEDALR